jgi:hypothetical protein
MTQVVEVITNRGHSIRATHLKKIGPVAMQKVDLWRKFRQIKSNFSRPTLNRWCDRFLKHDPIYNAAYFLMASNEKFSRLDGQGVKLHPYQVQSLTGLFFWSLKTERVGEKEFLLFLQQNPVDYRIYPDLSQLMEER